VLTYLAMRKARDTAIADMEADRRS